MRIFTGIQLAEEAKERICRELLPFRRAAASMRWTGREPLHLTLKFIGEVGESLAVKAGEALAAARIAVAPFRLRLSGFGKFPAGDDLRVFWAGVEESPQLNSLFAGVETALQPLGIDPDTRPFHPHVTLGRNKARSDFRELFALLGEKSGLFLGEWPVAAFQLFSSRLAPAGPVHTVLKEIPLVQS
jgi:RNA 2',3'-cyclic 3'-phosphodiesterase